VAETQDDAAQPSQGDKELIQLRERVDRDVRTILRNEMGGIWALGNRPQGSRRAARLEKANA